MVEAGLTTIADLQELPEEALVARFGKFGRRLARLVQGEDPRRVSPDRETKSVSTENTFARDLSGFEPLAAELTELAEHLAAAAGAGRTRRPHHRAQAQDRRFQEPDTADTARPSDAARRHHPRCRAERLLRREVGTHAYRLIGIGVSDVGHQRPRPTRRICSRMYKKKIEPRTR